MKNYTFSITILWLKNLVVFSVLLILFLLYFYSLTNYFVNIYLAIGELLAILAVYVYYNEKLSHRLFTYTVELIINETVIYIHWKNQLSLFGQSINEIRFTEIKDYVFESLSGCISFKIRLKDRRELKLIHQGYFNEIDDFGVLMNDFEEKVAKLNEYPNFKSEPILQGKGVWESNFVLLIGCVTVIIFIYCLSNIIMYSQIIKSSPIFILITLKLLWWIYFIYSKNRNRINSFFTRFRN